MTSIALALAVLALTACGSDDSRPAGPSDDTAAALRDTVHAAVADDSLAVAILAAVEAADPPTLSTVTQLDAGARGIASLAGIGLLPGLTALDLHGNAVTDIGPLRALPRLRFVDLAGNAVVDLEPLSRLDSLQTLQLADNRIDAIRPLTGLPLLTEVDLSRNPLAATTTADLDALRSRDVRLVLVDIPEIPDPPEVLLAFTRNDDGLFTVPLSGGEPVSIARMGRGLYGGPLVAPDGSRLAFSHRPDGGKTRIYFVDPDGANLQQLESAAQHDAPCDWSPDGRTIAFTRRDFGRSGTDLYALDVETMAVRQLTDTPDTTEIGCRYSPGGAYLAVRRAADPEWSSAILDAATGREVRAFDISGIGSWASWSPTGDRLAFTADGDLPPLIHTPPGGEPTDLGVSSRVFVVPVSGGEPQQLFANPDPRITYVSAAWSPTADLIACFAQVRVSADDLPQARWLELHSPSGDELERIEGAGTPTWRPDGEALFYAGQVYDVRSGAMTEVIPPGGEPVGGVAWVVVP